MSLPPSEDVLVAAIRKAFQMEEAPEVTAFAYYVPVVDYQKHGFHIHINPGDRLYVTKYFNYYIKHPDNTYTWYGDGQRSPFPVESIQEPYHAKRISARTISAQQAR